MGRSNGQNRQRTWYHFDTGVQSIAVSTQPSTAAEAAPRVALSLFSEQRGSSATAVTGGATLEEVHDQWVDETADGTILAIRGVLLVGPTVAGIGAEYSSWSAGITLLPYQLFNATVGTVVTNQGNRPNPNGFDQTNWIWHQSGYTDYTAEGAQTPFVMTVYNRSKRTIRGAQIPAFCFSFDTKDGTSEIQVGMRGRILVLRP